MNNPVIENLADPSSLEIRQAATLIAGALNSGRVKFHPNGSFVVDGVLLCMPETIGGQQLGNKMQSDGKTWALHYDGRSIAEPNRLGFLYISRLIQVKGAEIHATELVTFGHDEPTEVMKEAQLSEEDVAVEETEDGWGAEPKFSIVTCLKVIRQLKQTG